MNEFKELRKPAKRKGATRMIISGFKRNIYFIDLMDFSSKQDKWTSLPNKTNGFKKCCGRERVVSTRIVDTNMFLYVSTDIRNI